MKRLIILLYPFNFRKFDFERFEIEKLRKENDVIIFDFIDILYPNFAKAYFKDNKISKKVKKVKNIYAFKKSIFYLIKNYGKENILVLNFVKNDTLKSVKINHFIKSNNLKSVGFFNPGVSTYNFRVSTNFNLNKILIFILKRKNETIQKLKGKILNLLVKMNKINPDFLLVAGKHCKNQIRNHCKKNKIKIIDGHSWDYSSILRNKFKKKSQFKDYAVYLDAPGPKFLSDSFMFGEKFPETVEHTYPSLNNFFSYLEKKESIKVIIAPHPKTKIKDKSSLFDYRRVISNKTQDLIKYSKFIITRNSTAVMFAAYYKKPIILFYTDELIHTVSQKNTLDLANALKVNVININQLGSINLKKIFKFNKNFYNRYLLNYCTTNKNKVPNYKLITNLFNNN